MNSDISLITRRQHRSLDAFLKYNFDSEKRLAVLNESFNGKTYKVLTIVNPSKLSYTEHFKLYWNQSSTLDTVASFVQENLPCWKPQDKEQQMKCERQCAILSSLVADHNEGLSKDQKAIDFTNPFNKTLHVIVNIPNLVDSKGPASSITHDIIFDSLTPIDSIAKQVSAFVNGEFEVQFPLRTIHTAPMSIAKAKVVPGTMFKNVIQDQELVLAHLQEANESHVTFTFKKPDAGVVNWIMMNQQIKSVEETKAE